MFVVSGLFTRFQLGGLLHCLSLPTAVLPANEGEREDWLERWREMRNRKEEEGACSPLCTCGRVAASLSCWSQVSQAIETRGKSQLATLSQIQ